MIQVPAEFEDIRSYSDSEVKEKIASILSEKEFKDGLDSSLGKPVRMALCLRARSFSSVEGLQKAVCLPLLRYLSKHKCDSFSSDFSALPSESQNFIYISNHRDIVLDSAFLDFVLLGQHKHSAEIAIGDNLLIKPWIENLVRLNRSFIVRRSASASELLESSAKLSRYIRFVITEKQMPVWIAQREGRAKDSDDRTQKSVLKMLAMSGEGAVAERLRQLHIAPSSISYEYDPCDWLKAREFQMKRDFPDFRKSKADDLLNMKTGIFGYKGRVHYQASALIDSQIDGLDTSKPRNAVLEDIAGLIDRSIFSGYRIYPGNRVAMDLLDGTGIGLGEDYTEKEKLTFENYIEGQLAKIEMENPDWEFLRHKLLEMYANPLRNQNSLKTI